MDIYHALVTCSCCGARYATRAAFRTLRLAGYQSDGAGGHLELRYCRCGKTTLSIEIPAPAPVKLAKCAAPARPTSEVAS